MAKQPQVYGFSQELGQKIAKQAKRHVRRNGVLEGSGDEVVFDIRYAVVASDASVGDLTIFAWPGKLSASNRIVRDTAHTKPIEVINLDGIFTEPNLVRAGYGFLIYDDEDGNLTPICQRCIAACNTNGSITFSNQTFAVGDAVDVTVSTTNVSSLAISRLPDGLTFDAATGKVFGTPTKAQVVWSAISGTSPVSSGTGTCTVTKLIKWTIE